MTKEEMKSIIDEVSGRLQDLYDSLRGAGDSIDECHVVLTKITYKIDEIMDALEGELKEEIPQGSER